MKIVLLGPTGQVGWELQRSLAVLGEVVTLGRQDSVDFADPESVARRVRALRPDVIVNAAAHTAVDRAEAEPELAHLLNAATPALLAREAAALGALLVHYSTDYVFDGSGSTARTEDAPTAPLSVYGRTKLEGEQAIAASGCRHLIFRTSWVYAARGGNFAKTMLRLAQERERLTVIDDQWGAPTGAELIADVTAHAIRHVEHSPQDLGLYNLVASGQTCWHAYASFVIETARNLRPDLLLRVSEIAPVPTSAFPTPAQRPLNSRLDTSRLQARFGLRLPDWQQGVIRMLHETL
jgi:dTDP-4-dehydrorhamnose reductase